MADAIAAGKESVYYATLGRYQIQQYALHLLPAFTAGVHMLSQVTVGASPDHRCAVAPELNSTHAAQGSCLIRTENDTLEQCAEWEYDTTHYGNTIVTDWNLVCDRRWMRASAQSIFMFGVLSGAVILGSLADKYGRLKILYASSVLQVIFGIASAFCYHYVPFVIVKYFLGMFGSAGAYMTGFVLTMEMVGPKYRTPMGFGFQAIFAVGVMFVAAWGAFIKDWSMLQLIYGLHGVLLLAHWWLVDESVRWLYTQGREKEAKLIVEKSLRVNGTMKSVAPEGVRQDELDALFSVAEDAGKSFGLMDLLKTPRMRLRTLNVCLNWFANSLVYYGLSLNTDTLLVGNPFLMLFLVSSVEIPAYALTPLLVDRFGRRSITSLFMLIGGGACIAAAFIPKDTSAGATTVIALVMLGKLLISGSFAIIYNYTAELFPTVIRNSAVGAGTMCARLSGTLTPLISLLDSFDPKLPSVIFGTVSLVSGFLTLFLPETLHKEMPQTLLDGENFGRGDTAFSWLRKRKEKASGQPESIAMLSNP